MASERKFSNKNATDSQKQPERKCPFVSERGPSCPLCGAPPTKVNLDPAGYGFCDDCGGRFRR